MTFTGKEIPAEDPRRTGSDGTAGTQAADPAQPDTTMNAAADVDMDAQADSGTMADARHSADTGAGQRWNEIQATFVDDPRGSVTQAASMADEAIEAFISAARQRQASLASSWQGPEAGTEELRTALRDYRAFWSSVPETRQPA